MSTEINQQYGELLDSYLRSRGLTSESQVSPAVLDFLRSQAERQSSSNSNPSLVPPSRTIYSSLLQNSGAIDSEPVKKYRTLPKHLSKN